jgi:putative endonuclease
MKGYMYILLCTDGKYYTGSTNDLERRMEEHQRGEGANFTSKRLPVELLYYEEYPRIDEAFYREKQVQGWSRQKKEALMNGDESLLHQLAECKNETHYKAVVSHSKVVVSALRQAQCIATLNHRNAATATVTEPVAELVAERSRSHRTKSPRLTHPRNGRNN